MGQATQPTDHSLSVFNSLKKKNISLCLATLTRENYVKNWKIDGENGEEREIILGETMRKRENQRKRREEEVSPGGVEYSRMF